MKWPSQPTTNLALGPANLALCTYKPQDFTRVSPKQMSAHTYVGVLNDSLQPRLAIRLEDCSK